MLLTSEELNLLMNTVIPPIDHFSCCSMVARYVGMAVPGLKLLELGTGYGSQIPYIAPHYDVIVSIDAMYDWVPDIMPDQPFDHSLVDNAKVAAWTDASAPWKSSTHLFLGNTFDVHKEKEAELLKFCPFDVLVVDACHHPAASVEADFWNHIKFMDQEFVVVFDDVHETDPMIACRNVLARLESEGRNVLTRECRLGGVGATMMYIR